MYKVGKKVKARVLYDFSTTPPRFALALTEHVLGLGVPEIKKGKKESTTQSLQEAYPIGTILEEVKVLRIEPERGVVVEFDSSALQGFIHVRPLVLISFLCSPCCRYRMFLMSICLQFLRRDLGKLAPYIELE